MSAFLFNTPADQVPNILTDKDLARLTPIARSTYQKWRCQGKGPKSTLICGRVYYSKKDVLDFFHPQNLVA